MQPDGQLSKPARPGPEGLNAERVDNRYPKPTLGAVLDYIVI